MNGLSHNLRRLRKQKGLNQGQLAEKAGLSRNAYRALETGQSRPRSGNLHRLAEALNVSAVDLVREVPALESIRFRCMKTLTAQQRAERTQIVSDAAVWLQDYGDLERLLGDEPQYRLAGMKRRGRGPEKLAADVRLELGLDTSRPIDDICDAVKGTGIKIYLFESSLEKVFGFSIAEDEGGPAIGVNVRSDISVERRIFTTAHELGHLVLHRNSYRGDDLEEDLKHEREANTFASHFLMPPEAFSEVWNETRGLLFIERVMKTKRHFLVSYRTVLMRLADMGRVDSSVWPRFTAAYERRYGKKLRAKAEPFPAEENVFAGKEPKGGEPSPLADEDFVEDRLHRLVRAAVEKELVSVSRGAEILGVTASQMRELMESWEMAA